MLTEKIDKTTGYLAVAGQKTSSDTMLTGHLVSVLYQPTPALAVLWLFFLNVNQVLGVVAIR